MADYDVIVLGTGGIGSAALYHLASRGARVLGLDRFPAGHDRGSSHGQTRIIRQAYFEHPDYVPLLLEAYRLWRDLEAQSGNVLLHEVGLLEVGPVDGIVVPNVRRAAEQYGLEIDNLTSRQAGRRFDGLRVPRDWEAVFEARAGYLRVELCVTTLIEQACRLGAAFHPGPVFEAGQEVVGWRVDEDRVTVRTNDSTYTARRLVITGGPWARELLADLPLSLRVLRKHLHWYSNADPRYHESRGCPTFFYELPTGYYYGFPARDATGVKVAEHSGVGQLVDDPLNVDSSVDHDERDRVERFVQEYLPGVQPPSSAHAVCMYTMSPDEHFIVDVHPRFPQVVFAAGLSGHGFKFATVLGRVLADLALDGETDLPIDFLGLTRF